LDGKNSDLASLHYQNINHEIFRSSQNTMLVNWYSAECKAFNGMTTEAKSAMFEQKHFPITRVY
jgi:hypothetical protein